MNLNYITGYDTYKNIDAFTLQYPKDDIEVASGRVIKIINKYEFKHSIDTDYGPSGSPIILFNTLKVIGIHKQGDKNEDINFGTFIGEIFKDKREGYSEEDNEEDNVNYIIGEIYISKDNIGENIRKINSYEEYKNHSDIKEEERNEKEIKECIIEINDKKIPFSYFYKFENVGRNKIKYNFKNLLTNCNYMFSSCSSLINIDLSNFNAQNVNNMKSCSQSVLL